MARTAAVFAAATLVVAAASSHPARFSAPSPWRQAERAALARGVVPGDYASGGYSYGWQQNWFPAYVDNFNYNGPTSSDTYQMRYLINDTYFQQGGPIFFYAGNEGFIELFAENTGFLWEMAPAYGALVVFAEHRYYGLSMPFGNASYDDDNLGPLGAEQAIADYANLLVSLKANLSSTTSPVIVWGGSYGGMLAAWMRYKYPAQVQGAIASSAPILQIPGLMPPGLYNSIVTQDFAEGNSDAPAGIFNTWNAMFGLMSTQPGRDEIAQHLNICGSLQSEDDVWNVIYWLNGAIGYLAMADYPYPASECGSSLARAPSLEGVCPGESSVVVRALSV
jgi:lysosomal Pro-X carboxypeptidase